nr:MAG TPA: hypothetical protein [Caudoviricetes sp.]
MFNFRPDQSGSNWHPFFSQNLHKVSVLENRILDFDTGSTVACAHKVERLIITSQFKKIFLIPFKLRLNEGIFGCLVIGIGIKVSIFCNTSIGNCVNRHVVFHLCPFL